MRFEMKPTPGRANKLPGSELPLSSQLSLFWYFIIAILLSLPTPRSVSSRIGCHFIACCTSSTIMARMQSMYSGASADSSFSGNIATPSPIARSTAGNIFVLRFSRLYPLHIATLLFVAALQPLYFNLTGYFFGYQNNDLTNLVLQLLMASNATVQNALSFNRPIWSISVEVLVYFFFFMILLVTRSWLLNVADRHQPDGTRAGGGLLRLLLRRRPGRDGAASGNVLGPCACGRECGLARHHRVSAMRLAVHEWPFGIDSFCVAADLYANAIVLPFP